MSIVVFAGPTISYAQVTTLLDDVVVLPPAEQGDLYRAAAWRPEAIALIDGCFERVPAVWHKEVLHALALGIPVFGASSMGALRAAELDAFGMIGVGEVYRAFADGALEDDDEVAVVHAPAMLDFRQLSEAMVDIRATLRVATREGVLDVTLGERVLATAKSMAFPERSIVTTIRRLREAPDEPLSGHAEAALSRLTDWLPTGFVSLKKRDAETLLAELASRRESGFDRPQADFRFENTQVWQRAVQELASYSTKDDDTGEAAIGNPAASHERKRLEAMCSDPAFAQAIFDHALVRCLAADRGVRLGRRPNATELVAEAEAFRRERGLETAEALERWLCERGLDENAFLRWLTGEWQVRLTREELGSAFDGEVLECLRADEPMLSLSGPRSDDSERSQ